MSYLKNLRGRFAAATFAVILPFAIVSSTEAQMALVSMTPAHGTEHVDPGQPLSMTFSQPLDTDVKFGGDDGFFIAAQVVPSVGDPEGFELNGSQTQLTVHVALAENTQYWIVLLGAKSQSGDDLDHPYAWTFSTGTLATGSVSGKVSFPGGSPVNAVVATFDPEFFADSFSNSEGDNGPQFAAAAVTGADGSYQIDYAPGGTYLPAVFKDLDGDGEPNPNVAGEGLGFYDEDGDRVPDVITISNGQSVTGIDLEIRSGTAGAVAAYDDAAALAQKVRADAALSGIQGGEVAPDGKAATWIYIFYSAASDNILGVALSFDYLLALDSVDLGDEGGALDLTSVLPGDWIDSPAAIEAAEAAGGLDFRTQHADAFIDAGLFNLDAPLNKSFVVADRQALWNVTYGTESNSSPPLQVVVDALTGEVLIPTATEGLELPSSDVSLQSYPNPSGGPVTVLYELDAPHDVEITVSNVLGQTVRRLVSGMRPAGVQSVIWDGTDDDGAPLAPGNYWFRLKTDRGVSSKSVTVVR